MRRAFGLFAIVALLAADGCALAQNYPSQRVTIVVPFTAGSITDGLARILADKLGEHVEAAGHRREQARHSRHHRASPRRRPTATR